MAKHLNAYAETNDLFPSLQFGFCKGLGTVMPLPEYRNPWILVVKFV